MATIIDVAKEAGVSKSTVSNVFSGKRPVRKEVKIRVLEAAKSLEYTPNYFARTLTTKEAKIIGINFRGENSKLSSFHSALINGVLQVCYEYGYRILVNILPLQYNDKIELQTTDCTDGEILLDPSENDNRIERYIKKNIPVVVIGRPPLNYFNVISFIDNDNIETSKGLTNHLIQLGHRQIIFLNTTKHLTVSQDREKGYKASFENHKCEWNQGNIFYKPESVPSVNYGYKTIKELLSKKAKFTAVITDNVPIAQGVYNALHEINLSIPDDISVAAFGDNSDYGFTPSLTRANLNSELLGMKAAKLLIEQCTTKTNITQRLTISSNIIIGNSVKQIYPVI